MLTFLSDLFFETYRYLECACFWSALCHLFASFIKAIGFSKIIDSVDSYLLCLASVVRLICFWVSTFFRVKIVFTKSPKPDAKAQYFHLNFATRRKIILVMLVCFYLRVSTFGNLIIVFTELPKPEGRCRTVVAFSI